MKKILFVIFITLLLLVVGDIGYTNTETLRPSAAGDSSQCTPVGDTPNYACVDEEVSDEDTTYVVNYGVTGYIDLYNLPNHSGSGTINFVKVYVWVKTYYGAYIQLKTHATVYQGDQLIGGAAPPWELFSHTWNDNPNTSSAWTWGEIDALQAGIKLFKNNAVISACTQLYVVVDYTPEEEEEANAIFFGTNF